MIEPLKLWKTKEVKDLLLDFYIANFKLANVDESFAEDIIEKSWNARTSKDVEVDRLIVNNIYEKVKTASSTISRENFPLSLIDLTGVKTFLDVGSNILSTINYATKQYPFIEEFFAIDVIPQKGKFLDSSKSKYFVVDSNATSFPFLNKSIDFINIQFVLHHFPNTEAIERILQNCAKVISKNGRLLLWEESFTNKIDSITLSKENRTKKIFTNIEFTNRFYNLTIDQRWEFIIVNDWIINVNNPHMQWSGLYKNWEEWVALLAKFGFKLNKEFNLGLRLNGKLKHGVHVMGEFRFQ